MLLGTLGAGLLGNILIGKGINKAGKGIVKLIMETKKVEKQQQKEKTIKTNGIFNAVSSFN